mmetsp:Transcript_7194/g.15775  ORF Transcript_7194/g.15775 Transcript_7194/m.15775 type:complete len:746 (+) Transcript_7194:167-2404(+)
MPAAYSSVTSAELPLSAAPTATEGKGTKAATQRTTALLRRVKTNLGTTVGRASNYASNYAKLQSAPSPVLHEERTFVVSIARGDRSLGIVFDSLFYITRLLPGCAAKEQGEIAVGDRLLAVDGVTLQPQDNVATFFPFGDRAFELLLLRREAVAPSQPEHTRREHHERIHREPSGKFFSARPGPVFQEIQWNEFCVLLPDGSSKPFNEDVRYTSLTGYLRKRKVMKDGRAEFALMNGEHSRGWHRHFIHLSIQKLAWFDEDPQKRISPLGTLKLAFSKKGVGSTLFYMSRCRIFSSRLHREQLAISFADHSSSALSSGGTTKVLLLEAANAQDAYEWIVAVASCIYFSSSAFERLLIDCQRSFQLAPKVSGDKLSIVEALDLLREMGRDATIFEVQDAAAVVCVNDEGFGPREFAFLFRLACNKADPYRELIRAFEVLDPEKTYEVTLEDLAQALRKANCSKEHLIYILRSAGLDGDRINYLKLAERIYPSAAGNARAQEEKTSPDVEDAAVKAEERARQLWEVRRRQILAEKVSGSAETFATDSSSSPLMRPLVTPDAHVAASASQGDTAKQVPIPSPRYDEGSSSAQGETSGEPQVVPLTLQFNAPSSQANPIQMPLQISVPEGSATTPRSQVIQQSITEARKLSIGGATPRTIQDRLSRARKIKLTKRRGDKSAEGTPQLSPQSSAYDSAQSSPRSGVMSSMNSPRTPRNELASPQPQEQQYPSATSSAERRLDPQTKVYRA